MDLFGIIKTMFSEPKTAWRAEEAIATRAAAITNGAYDQVNQDLVRASMAENINGLVSKLPSKAVIFDSTGRSNSYFILENVGIGFAEKVQIIETFQTTYLQLFGSKPVMLNISGTLLNTKNYDWLRGMVEDYNSWMRGTQNLIKNTQLYMHWENITAEIALLGINLSENSSMLHQAKFSANLMILSTVEFDDSQVISISS